MLIMETGATKEQINRVVQEIEKCGLHADVSQGEFRTVAEQGARWCIKHGFGWPEDCEMAHTPCTYVGLV